MSGSTISTTLTSGITLTTPETTITATGAVESAGAYAVYGPNGTDDTLVNAGLISDSDGSGFGVSLTDGGSVSNTGSIGAAGTGVYAKGAAATLSNSGTITALGGVAAALLAGGSIGNATGALLSANGLGVVVFGSGTISNDGTIIGQYADGIELQDGGAVSNTGNGTIGGANAGIAINYATGSVTNQGIIGGAATYGVVMTAGGRVANLAGGTLSGTGFGVELRSAAGTVTNAGVIEGTGGGGIGVALNAGGTLVSSGTIIGAGGTAVAFAGGAAALVVDPGAVFTGAVTAATGYVNTVELGAGGAGSFATGNYTGFDRITVDPGATWTLSGAIAAGEQVSLGGAGAVLSLADPGDFAGTISGIVAGETLDLPTLPYAAGATATVSGGVLSVRSGGTTETLHVSGLVNGASFPVTQDSGTGSEVALLCFLKGTRLATPMGEVAVERLEVGDPVFTWDGRRMPITWIGVGRAILPSGRARCDATPVIVRRGALAPNVPHRDLRLTKGHALYLDGVLIPVEFLINHRSILWDDAARVAEVYHVELASHEVLIAEGAAAESYRDDGNRRLFQNANPGWEMPAVPPCAPIVVDGPVLAAAWQRLWDRAGGAIPVVRAEPDLHLRVDGARVDAVSARDGVWRFQVAAAPQRIEIVSQAGVPAALGLGPDQRRLGVAVRRVVVAQGGGMRVAGARDARLCEGFHGFEPAEGWRWTDGAAVVPDGLFAGLSGPFTLELHVRAAARHAAAA